MVGALGVRGLVTAKGRHAVDVLLKSVLRIVEPLREKRPDSARTVLDTHESDQSTEVSLRQVVGGTDLLLHREGGLSTLGPRLPLKPVLPRF